MTVPGTFRSAVEAKDLAAITGALDPGIEFRSPVMVKPYLGRDAVAALLGVLLEVFEDFHYTDELVGVPSGGTNGAGPRRRRWSSAPGCWARTSRGWTC
ncbi:hypothetical protein ACFQY7_48485 [Actinomadura luteofluorescens]|uniref:hypothetical protein n=1 Tax=Actinomadura luteofluorescens TaxID=46163 RepID=UPI003624FD76